MVKSIMQYLKVIGLGLLGFLSFALVMGGATYYGELFEQYHSGFKWLIKVGPLLGFLTFMLPIILYIKKAHQRSNHK
jgi:hypothetical protein